MRDCETGQAKELCKAAAFVITKLDGTTAGLGLICCDCHYAGVRWSGAEGIDRRVSTPADWIAIERELKAGLPTTLLNPRMACAHVLAGAAGVRVRWVGWAKKVEVDEPSKTPAMLDALLAEAAGLLG